MLQPRRGGERKGANGRFGAGNDQFNQLQMKLWQCVQAPGVYVYLCAGSLRAASFWGLRSHPSLFSCKLGMRARRPCPTAGEGGNRCSPTVATHDAVIITCRPGLPRNCAAVPKQPTSASLSSVADWRLWALAFRMDDRACKLSGTDPRCRSDASAKKGGCWSRQQHSEPVDTNHTKVGQLRPLGHAG